MFLKFFLSTAALFAASTTLANYQPTPSLINECVLEVCNDKNVVEYGYCKEDCSEDPINLLCEKSCSAAPIYDQGPCMQSCRNTFWTNSADKLIPV